MGFFSGETEVVVPEPPRPFPFRNRFPVRDEGFG